MKIISGVFSIVALIAWPAAGQTASVYVHEVPYFPSASHPRGQGFVRLFNRTREPASLTILAVDDEGQSREAVTLELPGQNGLQFNSLDLETGNREKGLVGATGSGTGDWRLEIRTETRAVDVMALVRAKDGFLTNMAHKAYPYTVSTRDDLDVYDAPIVNPARNRNQVSKIRITNHENKQIRAGFTALDDAGKEGRCDVSIDALHTATFDIEQLERGTVCVGTTTGFGTGTGKWLLLLASYKVNKVSVVSLLETPTGHLSNLTWPWVQRVTEETEEPDDHPDEPPGTVVAVPSSTDGRIEVGDDNDYFRFTLSTHAAVSIFTTSMSLDTYGHLYSTDGTELATNDDAESGLDFRIEEDLDAGTYDVRVRTFLSSRTGDYTLHVETGEQGGSDDDPPPASEDCRPNLTVRLGGKCLIYSTRIEFDVESNGRSCLASTICSASGHTVGDTGINGERVAAFAASRNHDDSWTISDVDPQPPMSMGVLRGVKLP